MNSPRTAASIRMAPVNTRLEQARQGDMDAFAELFEPLRSKVHSVACRMVGPQDAEDIVMDTFLKAWQALPGFRGDAALHTWLLRIARNRCLDVIRSRRAQPMKFELDAPAPGGDAPVQIHDPGQATPDELAANRLDARAAHAALATLDDVHREALLLKYEDGLSYAEIAAAQGVRIGTVMSRLFNARRKLARAMGVESPGGVPS